MIKKKRGHNSYKCVIFKIYYNLQVLNCKINEIYFKPKIVQQILNQNLSILLKKKKKKPICMFGFCSFFLFNHILFCLGPLVGIVFSPICESVETVQAGSPQSTGDRNWATGLCTSRASHEKQKWGMCTSVTTGCRNF